MTPQTAQATAPIAAATPAEARALAEGLMKIMTSLLGIVEQETELVRAGNVRGTGGFDRVWRESALFADLRRPTTAGACSGCPAYDSCQGGCMAAKFFTGLPLDGPDPECVKGHGAAALASVDAGALPRQGKDHSHRTVPLGMPAVRTARPDRLCDESPLAGAPLAQHLKGTS